jgi:hypothetical protein
MSSLGRIEEYKKVAVMSMAPVRLVSMGFRRLASFLHGYLSGE